MKSTKTKHGTLHYKPLGKGHFELTLYDLEADEEVKVVTTNALAIDAAFDDDYNIHAANPDNDLFFESQEQAQNALINEILN